MLTARYYLHADYYDFAFAHFSAVLFLGEEDADEVKRVGGESGIADEFELGPDGVSLKRGLVVKSENRRKRWLLSQKLTRLEEGVP